LILTEEAQFAYNEQRDQLWVDAFDETGLTAANEEQRQFFDTVIDPLAKTICGTAPRTLKGVAIKAIYMLDYARPEFLRKEPGSPGDEALYQFMEQLADLELTKA